MSTEKNMNLIFYKNMFLFGFVNQGQMKLMTKLQYSIFKVEREIKMLKKDQKFFFVSNLFSIRQMEKMTERNK